MVLEDDKVPHGYKGRGSDTVTDLTTSKSIHDIPEKVVTVTRAGRRLLPTLRQGRQIPHAMHNRAG